MNKFFATLILFFTSLNLLQAQDGYVKYITDSEYRNKTIKILKGEIVPFYNSTKSDKINVLIGKDTITELEIKSKNYEIAKDINEVYLSQKDAFIQSKEVGIVYVNANSIASNDTVTLISETGKQITKLIEKRDAQVSLSELGKTCRLIISNSPTIFYSTDKLKQFAEPDPVPEIDNSKIQQEGKTEIGWAWWYYALIALGVCGFSFGIWKYIKNKTKPHSNEVIFKGGSLTEFADQYGGLDKLNSLNKGIIPTKSEWNKLKDNESAKTDKVKGLKGKRIIIQAEDETSFGFQDSNDKTNVEQSHTKWESPKETIVQQNNFENNDGLSNQLREMENNLLREIQRVGSGNSNSNEINRLKNDKTELENKLRGFESEKRNLDSTLKQLRTDNSNLESNLQSANVEKNQISIEIKNLKEKVIAVDFLIGYSDIVFSYLKFCQQVSADAYNCFNEISHQNLKQAFAVGHLLMKFQTSINSIPIGNWLQTVQDIKDTKATTNKQVIRIFSQIQNDGEKQKEFQRLLFTEVLNKYSSSILILAEAFKNLSRFQVSLELANDIQNTFSKHVTEIVSKAKAAGLEIKYVSLFKNFEEYLGQIESVDKERTLAYREVSGLQKNEIAEIDSYGVKTNFEDSKTYVILA